MERTQADQWYWLARAYEVDAQPKLAAQAVTKASGLAPRSVPILRASARMLEAQRNHQAAAEVYARLVTLDRRYRTEYLQQLANIERQLGRRDKALQAGRDLIAAAPDNPEIADFFAQLCFQLNAVDEGLNALRRSARANASDPMALVRLASALLERQRTTEAIDLLWRAFDKSQKLDDRLPIVQKLAVAHAQIGQPDRLIERLTRLRRERSQRREMTLCLAQAHQAAGSDALAQKELESLLSEETRDPSLLTQLRLLAEKRQDWTTAANYQRQLWQMTQDKRDRYHLAQLLLKSGDSDAAVELLTTEEGSRELTADVLKLLDGLYENRKVDELLARLKPLRQRFPDSWELLYREGVALAEDHPERAVDFFGKILSMKRPEDEPSLARAGAVGRTSASAGSRLPLVERMRLVPQILSATHGQTASTYSTVPLPGGGTRRVAQTRRPMWSPDDYGEVRVAAWGWLCALASRHNRDALFTARLNDVELMPPKTRSVLTDQLAVAAFRRDASHQQRIARTLALLPAARVDERAYYLQLLAVRHQPTARVVNNRVEAVSANPAPLSDAEMDEALALYRAIARDPAVSASSVAFLSTVLSELKLAKRDRDADELLTAAEDSASTDSELVALSELAAISLRTEAVLRLLDRLIALRQQAGSPPVAQTSRGVPRTTQVMLASGQRVLMQVASGQYGYVTSSAPLMPLAEFLAKADRRDDLLAVWSRHLRLKALAVTAKLGSSSQAVVRTTSGFIQLNVSGRSLQLMGWIDIFDANDAQLLAAVSVGQRGTGPDLDLLQKFRTQAEAPDISRPERVIWLFARAHLLWWRDDRKAALSVLAEAVELVPERIDLRLNLAHLYEFVGQPADALAVVEAIVSDSPDVRHDCEQRALRLALATDRRDRAKVAAERLAGLKLPTQEVLPLAEQMLRLDMTEQAEALLARTASSTQADVRAMRLLMDIQLKQDRLDGATQTAMTLLQLLERGGQMSTNATVQFTSTASGRIATQPVNSGMRALSSNETTEYRLAVYKVLSRTGKLTELIDEAEAKLKETPTSEALIATLISYHTADENRRRVDELILKRHEIELNRPSNRYAAAIKCLELERTGEAIAHIRLLIEKEPAYFATRCTDTVFRFDERKQIPALTEPFGQIDWSLYDPHPQILPKVVELLMARADLRDHGTKLFLKEWQARPFRRLDMLHRFLHDDLWKLKEVSDGLRQIPFPTDAADVANQWSVFGRVLKHESDGTVLVTVLNRILTALAERGELDALAGDIEKRLAEWPKWTAGKVLLALVDLRRNRIEAGRDALDGLLPALSKQFVNSPAHAWEIAQELTRHDASLDVGIRYFEVALRDRGIEARNSSTSPVRGIVQSLVKRGRQADARRILLSLLPANVQREGDTARLPSVLELQVAQWVGRELRDIGHSIDAIHVYQAALDRVERISFFGHDPRVDLQSNLLIAFKELQPAALIEFFTATGDTAPQLDLQLFVTELAMPGIKLGSRWTPLLETIAANAETAAALKAVLAKTRERHPDDLSTLVLATQLALASKDAPDTKSHVARLVRHVEQHPLEILSTMPHIATKQRHAAQPRVALWLIARECLAVPELESAANQLTAAAVAAASQQSNGDFSAAITAELERPKPPAEEQPR